MYWCQLYIDFIMYLVHPISSRLCSWFVLNWFIIYVEIN
ncbi:hypothetical protein Leryth_027223 [Lithospermum erythrorhizon]|nr:hypothetical protein Leryth_027223 [Lithospermum erythrorhizon]